ncbi:MAG: hypothetical protein U5Q03_12680 [Bacteroidota bacterium]|nr:hypothetical protein [Bacteroidota bacterium]
MTRFKWIIIFLFLGITASAQNLDQILNDHFETIGQRELNKMQSMKVTGYSKQMNMETPFEMIVKRPNKMRIDIEMQGRKIEQAYNGDSAWMTQPFGDKKPVMITGTQLDGLRVMADMDGPLYEAEKKGIQLKLQGSDTVKGQPAYMIEAVLSPDMSIIYFIGQENHLIIKESIDVIMQGQEIRQENYFSDFRETKGIINACQQETYLNGQLFRESLTESIEYNVAVDDTIFEVPGENIEAESKF